MAHSTLAGGSQQTSGIYVPGYLPQPGERPSTVENFVAPAYFETVGMRLLRGREIQQMDTAASAAVAVVNEAFQRRYFAGSDPLGRRYGYSQRHSGFEIVGIVADAKTRNPKDPAVPMVYRPLTQDSNLPRSIEVRTANEPRALISQMRLLAATETPDLPVIEVATLEERVNRTVMSDRLLSNVTSSFASAALLLACVGLYGLLAYQTSRRTAEIAIRMALAAERRHVIGRVLRECSLLLLGGLLAGMLVFVFAARLLRSLLYGLSATDPWTLTFAAVSLCAMGFVSAYVPASRASRVDPAAALKQD